MKNNVDFLEMIGQIIDVFEDFLTEKEVTIDNPEKDASETDVLIYGHDYDRLYSEIMNTLLRWNLIEDGGR